MKSKRKEVKKYFDGGILTGAIAQGVMGLGQAGFGLYQRAQARRQLEELQRNRPDLQIPTALRRLVNEPISERYMEAQEMGAQRRTAQSIDTLGKMGSRGLGAVQGVLENERRGEQQRAGQYEQARRSALGQLASAESRIQDMRFQNYMNDVNAARGSLEAAQQNIFGGLGQVGRSVSTGINQSSQLRELSQLRDLIEGMDNTQNTGGGTSENNTENTGGGTSENNTENTGGGTSENNTTTLSTSGPTSSIPPNLPTRNEIPQEVGGISTRGYSPIGGVRQPNYQLRTEGVYDPRAARAYSQIPNFGFEEGGVLKTKGVFSHRKNPKDLVDRDTGEVEAELTGNETVFNKEQSDKMESLANSGKDKELRKFVKSTFKKFKTKRKNG